MKKLMMTLFLGLLVSNVGLASYGEDMKGECKNGTGSSRGQEQIVVSTESVTEVKEKEVKGK